MSRASSGGTGSKTSAAVEIVGLTLPSGATWAISFYRFRCEAYNQGTLVATQDWAIYTENDQEAGLFATNHLAVWGQQLTAQGIIYDRLTAAFLGKS